MKKLKSNKKPNPHRRWILIPFKVNAEEMRVILRHSHGNTQGNISAWVRYAALHFKPSKTDFEK